MKIITLALLFYCLETIASNEIQIKTDPNHNIITLSEEFKGNEKLLLQNDLIFSSNISSKQLTSELQTLLSNEGNKRVIPIGQTLEDLVKLPSSAEINALRRYLEAQNNNENEECGRKGEAFQTIFASNGSCPSGNCVRGHTIPDEVIHKALAYDKACQGGQSLPNRNERLSTTIAIYIQDTYLCSGFKTKDYIITARHCFYINNYVPEAITRNTIFEDNELIAAVQFEYSPLSDMKARHTIRAFLKQGNKIGHYTDALILNLSESSSSDISEYSSHPPIKLSQAQLTTVNRFLVQDQDELDNAIREYNKPMCSIIAANDKCVFHNCSALPTNSGAPVYQFNNNQNKLIGIHVGILDRSLVNQCGELNSTYKQVFTRINVAIPINKISNPMFVNATEI